MNLIKKITLSVCLLSLFACVSYQDTSVPESQKVNVKEVDRALVHAMLAEGYLQKKQYATVELELAKAFRVNPRHSQANYILALLNIALGNYDEADRAFYNAVDFDSKNSAASHDYGTFLCQRNKEKESVKYFLLAANNPLFETPELSFMRAGECLANIGDDAAQAYLEKALSIRSDMPPALYKLATIKYSQKNLFAARAYIQRYLAARKATPRALSLAYKIEKELDADVYAKKYREQLLNMFPSSSEAKDLRNR